VLNGRSADPVCEGPDGSEARIATAATRSTA
jgi:hypothetical protein